MEDWEKRFSELEAEVDAEFDKKNKKLPPKKDAGDEPPVEEKKKKSRKTKTKDDDDNLFDDVARQVATKAIQKTAEKSLAKIGTNKAIVYSVAAILGLMFIWSNLFPLLFGGAIIGGLYYYLEVYSKDDSNEPPEEIEEDD